MHILKTNKNIRILIILSFLILVFLTSIIISYANEPYDPAREKYRPVIGGVKIEIKMGLFTSAICTSSFSTSMFGENLNGIITAGHCSNYETGKSVRQPSWFWNKIGKVYNVGDASDSEFVQATEEVAPYILHIKYYSSNDTYVGYKYLINGYYSFSYIVNHWDIYYGLDVFYKTGQTTGTTKGAILEYYYSFHTDYAGTLRYTFIMTNYAQPGDSGSPLYRVTEDEDEGNFATLLGILSGIIEDGSTGQINSIVVSVTAVQEDLNIVLDSSTGAFYELTSL